MSMLYKNLFHSFSFLKFICKYLLKMQLERKYINDLDSSTYLACGKSLKKVYYLVHLICTVQ